MIMACASSTPTSQIASCSSSSPASPTLTLDPCLALLPGSHTNSNGHTYIADHTLDDMEFYLSPSGLKGTSSPSESVATLPDQCLFPESIRQKLRSSALAEEFLEDVSILMKRFSDLKSVEFKDFRKVWSDLEFDRVYECWMNQNHLYIFTDNIYVVTSQFLLVDCFYMNIGAVYALYTLYIMQEEGSQIPIHIEIEHFKVITDLRRKAIENKYLALHYMIDYLLEENCFVYVKSQYKFDPLCTFNHGPKKQATGKHADHKHTFKDDFNDYRLHSILPLFKDAMKEYNDAKMEINVDELPASQTQVRKLEELIMKRDNVLNSDSCSDRDLQIYKATLPIGLGLMTEEETKKCKKDAVRAKLKKSSLPPKQKSENEIAISRLIEERERLFSPTVTTTKNVRTRRATYVDDSERPKRKPKKLPQSPSNQQQQQEENDHDDEPKIISLE